MIKLNKKQFMSLVLSSALAFSPIISNYNILNYVYAEPDDTTNDNQDNNDNANTNGDETQTEESQTEESQNEESQIGDETTTDTSTDVVTDGYIEHIDTKDSDATPYQVNVSVTVPTAFSKDTYAIIQSDKNGQLYRITMRIDGSYSSKIFLPEGSYTVTEVGVYDETDAFEFDLDENEDSHFTVNQDTPSKSISFSVKNVDNLVQDETTGHYSYVGDEEEEVSNSTLFDTYFDNIKLDKSGVPHYVVTHEGSSIGTLDAYGFTTGDYDIIVKITEAGVIGEAKFAVSFDGGVTYTSDMLIEDSITSSTNITYEFSVDDDNDEFVLGDTFSFSTKEMFQVTGYTGNFVPAIIYGHPSSNHELSISILSSGGLGQSKFTITDGKGNMTDITDIIPEDGVYELEDGLTIVFSSDFTFNKNQTFSSNISTTEDTVDYKPLYILYAIIGGIVVLAFMFLLMKKDKPANYRIKEYDWRQEEDKYN